MKIRESRHHHQDCPVAKVDCYCSAGLTSGNAAEQGARFRAALTEIAGFAPVGELGTLVDIAKAALERG